MRGYNHQLVVTTTTDEATGNEVPLFAFPVQVCKAVADQDISFDSAGPSGAPVKRRWLDTGTGEIVEDGDKIKGVRTGDSFTEIPAEQIKAIDESLKSDVIAVERTFDLDEVPFDRVIDRAFLQVPTKGTSHKHYRLVYEGLLARPKKGKTPARPAKAMLVKYVGTTRQKLGVIYADEKAGCLMLLTVRFGAEVREPDEQVLAFQLAEVEEPMIEKVRAVLDGLDAGDVDWDTPVDETIAKRAELVEQALAGEAIVPPKTEAEVVTTDAVADALEASLAAIA